MVIAGLDMEVPHAAESCVFVHETICFCLVFHDATQGLLSLIVPTPCYVFGLGALDTLVNTSMPVREWHRGVKPTMIAEAKTLLDPAYNLMRPPVEGPDAEQVDCHHQSCDEDFV
jgi:hypothetical protein